MPLKDFARSLRDGILARERLRRANPGACVAGTVMFAGDARRTRLAKDVSVLGPTALFVTDGGGLTGASLEVGERTYIGEFNNIRCAGASIRIGRDCLVSQHITIVGSNHGTEPGTPIVDQPWHGDGVVVGDDVWIGAGAVILPGTRLGDGCVVAANSTVKGEIPPNSVVAGSPARVLRTR
ncbi:acyltransferase [Mobilicoccus massiliensis]|uniref:acyltransferase n=1 Tax=Mobilicoccus massiliensis TaxID=1522310 RepID=UPI00058C7DD1|nr:acyltransferase [Mobilicoccus massiliensis]